MFNNREQCIEAAWEMTLSRVRHLMEPEDIAKEWGTLADLLGKYEKEARERQKVHNGGKQ